MAEKVAVPESSLNEAEAELYDRQLRLWGFEAQQRMQKSKILFCGIRGLFAETAKNLVLAGMNVTVQDSDNVDIEDMSALYFATVEEVGQKRAKVVQPRLQALNCYVTVDAETTPLSQLSDEFFSSFSVILVTDCSEVEALRINEIARKYNIPFFWAGCYAEEGWFIADFGKKFEYQSDPPKCDVADVAFPSVAQALAVPWKDLVKRHFPISEIYVKSRLVHKFRGDTGRLPGLADIATVTQLANSLLSENGVSLAEDDLVKDVCLSSWGQSLPVCSILGGFLSQEVVKAVSKIGDPMLNTFVFSSKDFVGKAFAAVPKA